MEHKGIVRIGRLLSGHEVCERGAFRTIYARKSEDGTVEFVWYSYGTRMVFALYSYAVVLQSFCSRLGS